MTTHLERINRCVRSTLAHQRKNNKVDIFMVLQRVDYKINRQPLGHKLVDEMRYATSWDIQDAKQNLIYAMDYLFDVEKYPYIDDKLIDKIDKLINIRLEELSPQDVKVIIKNIIHKHLGWLVVWGGVFGFTLGLTISLIGTLN